MIPHDVKEEIIRRLERAENEHNVRILLAIESGSRAWGFASPNSDYDVRFIYAHDPDWYLAVDLEERRDVIEYPITDEIDLNGWDLRKALRLFWKSNPAFVEWIQSPIDYINRGSFKADAFNALPKIYSVDRGIHHYRSMAKTNYRGYPRADQVPLKKYFYALRPLLAVKWLESSGTPAPIEFERLLEMIGDRPSLLKDIHRLLDLKRAAPEMGLSAPVPSINKFIESELARLENIKPPKLHEPDRAKLLNVLFHKNLREQS